MSCAIHSTNGSLVSLDMLANSPTLVLDVEGSGYHIGTDIPYGYSITSVPTSSYYASVHDSFFTSLLADDRKLKIAFNAKYDRAMLVKAGVVADNWCDPMIAAHLLGDQSLSLQILVGLYLREDLVAFSQLSKPLESMTQQELADYSGPHAEKTLALWSVLYNKLKRLGLLNVFFNIEMPLVPVLSDMELNGVAVDVNTLSVLGEEFDKKISVLSKGLDYWSGHPGMNHNSPDQVADLLYRKLDIPVGRATKQGERASVDKRYLETIKDKHSYIPMYLFYKELKTLKHSYVDSLKKQIVNGRIHGSFNQTRTATGRLSCVVGNTMVATQHGYKPIKDVRTGDFVLSATGLGYIRSVVKYGKVPVVEVKFSDGGTVKSTLEHRFLILRAGRGKLGKKGSVERFVPIKELHVGDLVWISLKELPGMNNAVMPNEFISLFGNLDEKAAEFLGLCTAEQCTASTTKTNISSNTSEQDIRDYFLSWLLSLGFNIHDSINGNAHTRRINSPNMVKVFQLIGMVGHSAERRIPPILLTVPVKLRAAYLRGLFTGDGTNPYEDVSLVTSSADLAQDVRLMLNSLGIMSTVAWYDTWATSTMKHGDRWCVRIPAISYLRFRKLVHYIGSKNIGLDAKISKTDFSRAKYSFGAGRLRSIHIRKVKESDYSTLPVMVKSIEGVGVEDVYDLDVGLVHQYTANCYITHNSSDPNLQKIPTRTAIGKRIRTAFIAPPGHKLIKVDYKLIELVMMAHQSQDPALLAAFRAGRDLHTETAVLAYNDPGRRREAKTLNFKLIYLGGSKAEQEMLFSIYPGVREWTDKMALILRENMYARTLGGRIRTIDELEPYNSGRVIAHGVREGISTMIQGSSAEEVKKGMVRAYKQLKGSSAKIVLQVHDEVVYEVPVKIINDVLDVIWKTYPTNELSVPLKIDIEIGDNWGTMTKIKEGEKYDYS